MGTFATALYWLGIGQQIFTKGKPVVDDFLAFLKTHNIEADNAKLADIIGDAARRQALAEFEAGLR